LFETGLHAFARAGCLCLSRSWDYRYAQLCLALIMNSERFQATYFTWIFQSCALNFMRQVLLFILKVGESLSTAIEEVGMAGSDPKSLPLE
jgi:hypothetical protein